MTRDRVLWLLLATTGTQASATAEPALPLPGTASTCAVIPLADTGTAEVQQPAPAIRHERAATFTSPGPVVRYQIIAVLDPHRHTINGTQLMTWRNRSALPVCTLYLHLDLNAFEGAGSRFMVERQATSPDLRLKDADWGYSQLTRIQQRGQSAVWTYEQPGGGAVTDRTVVRVDLPHPVAPGASTTLDIGFFDQLPGARIGTGYHGSFHLIAHWFPQIAALELPREDGAARTQWNASSFLGHNRPHLDTAAFDVRLDVPKGYSVGATGTQAGPPVTRGNRVVYRFLQENVTDFAWTADSRFAAPLHSTYVTPAGETVTLQVLYQPEHAAAAASAMDVVTDTFGYYSRRLRAYPYRTLTAVIMPYDTGALAGRTYPTLFTVAGKTAVAPGTLRGDERLDVDTVRGVTEMYFSSVLNSDADPETIRGITAYWTARRLHERGQTLHPLGGWMQRFGLQPNLDSFSAIRIGARLRDPVDGIGVRAARIALSLHDLQERIGIPAMDRAFWLYTQRQRAKQLAPVPVDQQQAIELALAPHIGNVRLVDDRIASFSSEEVLPQPGYVDHQGRRIKLTQAMIAKAIRDKRREWKQRHADDDATRGAFPYRTMVIVHRNGAKVPQVLQVVFADGSTRRIHWNNAQPSQRFTWITPAQAVSAQLDPQRQVLLDRNKLDDGRSLRTNVTPARRGGGDIAAAVQVIAAFLVSL